MKIGLCGNCFFFCQLTLPVDDFDIVMKSGDCLCRECKHQAHFNAEGREGHWASSTAYSKGVYR